MNKESERVQEWRKQNWPHYLKLSEPLIAVTANGSGLLRTNAIRREIWPLYMCRYVRWVTGMKLTPQRAE